MGGEAFKPFNVDILRERSRIAPGRATLRDVVELTTCEQGGDFRGGMSIAAGELIAERTTVRNGRRITVERRWPLECFKSIADYLHADPDWCPPFYDD
jgi:hypothetical protein